jgi:sugar lactone lactonase YvrE
VPVKTRVRTPLVLAGLVAALLAVAPLASAAADTIARSLSVIAAPRVVDVTPNGSKVVMVSVTNAVSVVDVASGAESTPVALGAATYNVAVSPSGATALVPTTNGDLWFVDMATGVVTGPVNLDSYLFDVAFSLDGTLAYVTTGLNSIVVVDVASRAEVGRFTLSPGTEAYGIALAPDGATLFVTSIFASTLLQVDAATGVTTGTFATAPFPSEVVVRADGWAYVASFVTGSVGSVDPVSGSYAAIALSGTGNVTAIALSPDGSRLYVPRGFGAGVSIVDTTTNTEITPLVTGLDSRGIAFSADGTTAFVGDATTPAVLVIAVDRPPVLAGGAPAATIGAPYSFTVGAGGSPAPTFSLTAGALPTGLTLDPASGVISGTPTALGTSSFSITATNGSGTAIQAYTLTVAAAAVLAATGLSSAPLLASGIALLVLGLGLNELRRRSNQSRQGTSGVR